MRRPENGHFVLLDMGYILDLDDRSLTKPGLLPGTPYYLSPEQIDLTRKRQLDFRSDLFNLGIVLYESATGLHPFKRHLNASTSNMFLSILTYIQPPPITIRLDLPPKLDAIIMRLLKKRPYLRFSSCEQLEIALNNI
jgi:serine/threonine-protein kinase